jgi:hypothetical protein
MSTTNNKLRKFLTIGAEIATIISLVITVIIFRNSQNSVTTGSSNLIIDRNLFIGFIIVNSLMFIYITIILVRNIIAKRNGDSFQIEKKFDEYIQSESDYLNNLPGKTQDLLIKKTKKSIKRLDSKKAFDQDVYYMLLFTLFFTASDDINVISILDDNEWVDTPEEDEFLRLNLNVIEKSVHLNRVFVINKIACKEKLNNKSIQSFINSDRRFIHPYAVFYEDLPRNVINDIGSGFIVFEKEVVACDIFSDNEIRGYLKFEDSEIDRYNRIFMRVTEFIRPINDEFKNNYL